MSSGLLLLGSSCALIDGLKGDDERTITLASANMRGDSGPFFDNCSETVSLGNATDAGSGIIASFVIDEPCSRAPVFELAKDYDLDPGVVHLYWESDAPCGGGDLR